MSPQRLAASWTRIILFIEVFLLSSRDNRDDCLSTEVGKVYLLYLMVCNVATLFLKYFHCENILFTANLNCVILFLHFIEDRAVKRET